VRGEFYEGQAVEFTPSGKRGRGGVLQAVCVEFAGKRWVVRATDGKTWRVPATMLRVAKLAPGKAAALLDAGIAREKARDEAQEAAQEKAHARLAPLAARYTRGMQVEVVHRGTWGWSATVLSSEGGKVTVTNPTRGLLQRVALLNSLTEGPGLPSLDRRTTRSITVWANRVRLPGDPRVGAGFALFGF
jgi:hypothetical protein